MLALGKGKKKGSFLSETEVQQDSSPPQPKRSPSPKPERKGKEKEEREAVPPPVYEEEPLSRNDSSNTTWYGQESHINLYTLRFSSESPLTRFVQVQHRHRRRDVRQQ
jgi:hypothetical protein